MNLIEKLTSIDKNKIQRQDMLEQLEGVIFEYDEKDQDSIDNAQTILEILTDLYPGILSSETKEDKKDEAKEKEKEPKKDLKETSRLRNFSIDKKYIDKGEKITEFKETELEHTDEEAKVILDNMSTASYNPHLSEVVTRSDGTVFFRKYLDDYEAKRAFEQKKKVCAEDSNWQIYPIRSAAQLVYSYNQGMNHFIASEEGVEKEKSSDKKEDNKKDETKASKTEQKPEKKKITKDNKKDCDLIVSEIRTVLQKYQQSKPKARKEQKKRPLATVVKESVVVIIKRVINKEKERNPAKELDIKKFQPVIDKGKEFLKALRKASGGISDDNDQMISSFEKQMKEILDTLKKAA